jgi:predicted transcriptional regulator
MTTKEIDKAMLISISRRLDDLFEGKKLWEYRRSPPNIKEKTMIVVYDSGKSHSIVGEFFVQHILRGSIEEIITKTIKETTSPESALREYFVGLSTCSALRVEDPKRYKTPLSLPQIRELVPGFMPPQGFIYLRRESKKSLSLFDTSINEDKLLPLFDTIMRIRQE